MLAALSAGTLLGCAVLALHAHLLGQQTSR
jgi:hypothetical protein